MTGILTPRERSVLRDLVARERVRREDETKRRERRYAAGYRTRSEALAELRQLRPERTLRRQVEQLRATFAYCDECDKPYEPAKGSNGPRQRYCSHACNQRAYLKRPKVLAHGKRSTYVNALCRCPDCTEAAVEYSRERRLRAA